jgi:opacity protein-like surface antigen
VSPIVNLWPNYSPAGLSEAGPRFDGALPSSKNSNVTAFITTPTSRGYATKGTSLLGIGTLPVTQGFSLFGKVGVVRGDEDGNLNFGGPAYRLDGSTELTYGLGLKYDFSSNLGLRLEWQRFTPGGYLQPFGEGDVDLLSGGLRYRF